ncbi:hypothetical protein FGRMN_1989 [Fusarium graminum]|nr:hypothetical protein FGRMN_1989 [Fusarium graminum]
MNPTLMPPKPIEALIGFRVECQDEGEWFSNRHLLNEGDLLPHGCVLTTSYREGFREAADSHLTWKKRYDSPFISFFRSWDKAMGWRKWMIKNGGKDIVIVAVWLGGLTVYDAYAVARWLGYPPEPWQYDPERRCIRYHSDELLLLGGIRAEDYRVLACFYVNGLETERALLSPLNNGNVLIPRNGLATFGNTNLTASERLAHEMYSLTGVWDSTKLSRLIQAMCGQFQQDEDEQQKSKTHSDTKEKLRDWN